MTSPMSPYANSDDANDFLSTYKRKVDYDKKLAARADVVQDFGESYERAYQLLNTFQAEAYKDVSYYLSNQWSLEELSYLNNQRRSSFTYNKIRRIINLIEGQQRKNRLASIVAPIEDSSEQTSVDLTDVLQYVMNYGDGYDFISDGFRGGITSGLSFISPWMDYRDDPVSGDVKFHHDAWNAVMFDPFVNNIRTLDNCGFFARRRFLPRTEVISLIPDKEDVIKGLPWGSRDDKFTYMPYARQWGMQKLLNYNEYWRTKWEMKEVLVDMQTGETRDWTGPKNRLKMVREIYPQLQIIKKPVKTVELGIIVEGELLYYGTDPWGLQDYPFVGFAAIWEPSYDLWEWKIQSLVRVLRDSQTEINKRRSKMVDMYDNQLATGWKAKKNSVENPSSLYKTGQGQVVWMKDTAQMTDAEKLTPPMLDGSIFQLEAEFEKDMFEVMGISPENVGMAENDKIESAAILSKMRQAAGWLPMQPLFDGLRQSQKILSEKVLKLIQINYTPEKVKMILKREPTQEFFSKIFGRYSIVVEEGLLTDTQKQDQFVKKIALKSMGVNITDSELISSSNLHDKKEIGERMQGEAQAAQQMQQMQAQLQMKAVDSKSNADNSLAAERFEKISLDKALNAERISRAEEERTAGALNLVKAAKELQGMDLEHLMLQIQMLKELADGLKPDQAEVEKKADPSTVSVD